MLPTLMYIKQGLRTQNLVVGGPEHNNLTRELTTYDSAELWTGSVRGFSIFNTVTKIFAN